jgi:putative Mg2+ transporter-C (MgtC) family protein
MEIFIQLLLATLLGGLIGLEREYKRKEAGLRTYALVALGAAFFVIISYETATFLADRAGINFDPTRIIGQIVLGIGFLGAGLIIFRGFHIEGLTTAAGLWVTSAVGVAVGAKLYLPALFVSLIAVGVLSGLRLVEERFFGKKHESKG